MKQYMFIINNVENKKHKPTNKDYDHLVHKIKNELITINRRK